MKFRRWILITGTLFIIFALIFNCNITAFSVNLDGKIHPAEWNDCQKMLMFSNENESNCAIYYAYLNILESPATNEIFVGLMVTDSEIKNTYFKSESPLYMENSPIAVRLTVNGTELIIGINGELDYDKEPYHVTAVFKPDNTLPGYTVEIRIGVKELNFPLINTYIVQLVDSAGEPSSEYGVTIDSTPVTTTEPTTVITTVKPTTTKPTTTRKPTTTKPTTTKKPATTKQTTVKTTAEKTSATTPVRRWTTRNKDNTTLPKTTKPSTTATIKETTTKARKKTAEVEAKVNKTTTGASAVTDLTTQLESTVIEQTETQQSKAETKYIIVSGLPEDDSRGQMQKSHKIVLTVCFLVFVAFGIYAYFLQKKKKTE